MLFEQQNKCFFDSALNFSIKSRLKDKGKCSIFVAYYQANNGLNVNFTAKQMLFSDSALNFT